MTDRSGPGGTRAPEGTAVKVTRTLHHSVNVEGELAGSVEFYQRLFRHARRGPTPDPRHRRVTGSAPATPSSTWSTPRPDRAHPAGRPPRLLRRAPTSTRRWPSSEQAGIPYVEGAQGTTVQIWFTDPAGNTIEIQQETRAPRRETG